MLEATSRLALRKEAVLSLTGSETSNGSSGWVEVLLSSGLDAAEEQQLFPGH